MNGHGPTEPVPGACSQIRSFAIKYQPLWPIATTYYLTNDGYWRDLEEAATFTTVGALLHFVHQKAGRSKHFHFHVSELHTYSIVDVTCESVPASVKLTAIT